MSGIVRTEHTEDGVEHFMVPDKEYIRDHPPVVRTEHSHVPAPEFHPTPPPPPQPEPGERFNRERPVEVPHERRFTTRMVTSAD